MKKTDRKKTETKAVVSAPVRTAESSDRKNRGRRREDASFPAPPPRLELPSGYTDLLGEIKQLIQTGRLRTVMAANAAMITLYRDIGSHILERQEREGWGAKVIDRLSFDLRETYPDMRGLSPRNLKYMRAFAATWPDLEFVQRVVAQIPWKSNIALLEKLDDTAVRQWYAQKTIEHGWSQPVLCFQIETGLHIRQGKAVTNFSAALPPAESDMAAQIFKDPYLFDFLGTADPRREREVEQALIDHIQRFLLELGAGFAFVGRQVHLEFASHDFYLDLLFYHIKLCCFVVVELKAVPFDPGFVGTMNMYLSAVDDLLRHPNDKPSIGLILCRSKSKLIAEYALRGFKKPIGVAGWETQIVNKLPDDLKSSLPTVEEIEAELMRGNDSK